MTLIAKHFCNCQDLKCKHHPSNHSKGCDPCIAKNLQANEIPACFFRVVSEDLSTLEAYHFGDFARFYLENK
ncbi:DUF6485 family protein [Orenia marismortui]|uniref:DUF6485 family protein n=1 Tax=Orenia marismortui TaxID=46469 RepID=UPI003899097C